jgi:hypothetical protein
MREPRILRWVLTIWTAALVLATALVTARGAELYRMSVEGFTDDGTDPEAQAHIVSHFVQIEAVRMLAPPLAIGASVAMVALIVVLAVRWQRREAAHPAEATDQTAAPAAS